MCCVATSRGLVRRTKSRPCELARIHRTARCIHVFGFSSECSVEPYTDLQIIARCSRLSVMCSSAVTGPISRLCVRGVHV